MADLGDAGRQLGAAWRAKELLRDVATAPATRDKVAAALEEFFTFAATNLQTVAA